MKPSQASPHNIRLPVKTKLMGLLSGICLAALSMACAAFVIYDRQSYAEAKRDTMTVLVDAVAQSAHGAVSFGDPDSAAYVLTAIERESTALGAALYTAQGNRLALWTRDASLPALAGSLDQLDTSMEPRRGVLRIRRPITSDELVAGEIVADFSTADVDARTRRFLSIAAMVLLLSFLGAWAAASFFQRILTRPVANLVTAVTRVQQHQDFSVRAQKVSNDELGVLTESFNAMVEAIDARDRELAEHREQLERRVAERTRDLDLKNTEMRLVLNNVDQGLVTIDRDGVLQQERSEAFDLLFGTPALGVTLAAHLEPHAPGTEDAFGLAWEEAVEGLLPLELTLEQMPSSLQTTAGKEIMIEYRPILDGDQLQRALVIFTDVTVQKARERADAAQSETIALFESVMHDRSGFTDFFNESQRIIDGVLRATPDETELVLRGLHTLKGNFGVFRLRRMAEEIHELEDHCIELGAVLSAEDNMRLRSTWDAFRERVTIFLGEGQTQMTIDVAEQQELLAIARRSQAHSTVLDAIQALTHERCEPRLQRLAGEAKRLSERLGRGPLTLAVEGGELRIPPGSSWLWGLLPHLVRNAVDHGLNCEGLDRAPKLRLAVRRLERSLIVEIEDNGRGVNWEAVQRKALKLGLAHTTQAQLTAALFADKLSTRDSVSDISGRGVGLSAVKSEVEARGGEVEVLSTPGQGTCFRLTIPWQLHHLGGSAAHEPTARTG